MIANAFVDIYHDVYATATPSSTLMLQEIRNFWQRYVVSPTIQTVLAAFSCSIGRGVEQHASVHPCLLSCLASRTASRDGNMQCPLSRHAEQ
jgi:hypothetical protein